MKSLSEEMNAIAGSRSVQGPSTLHLLGPKGVTVRELDGAGHDMAAAARAIVLVVEPLMAVLRMEAWAPRVGLEITDPDLRRVALGEITPSMLPPNKRGEMLILYGETREGESLHRLWRIDTRSRQLTALPDADGIDSRFHPMFLVDDMLRAIDTGVWGDQAMPPEMVEMLREGSRGMSPLERRQHVQRAVARILLEGGGHTTSDWERGREDMARRNRAVVINSGPAASQ